MHHCNNNPQTSNSLPYWKHSYHEDTILDTLAPWGYTQNIMTLCIGRSHAHLFWSFSHTPKQLYSDSLLHKIQIHTNSSCSRRRHLPNKHYDHITLSDTFFFFISISISIFNIWCNRISNILTLVNKVFTWDDVTTMFGTCFPPNK